ncbi:MAG: wax ester/triacylglycerol synthase family O-acyltransferase, partial [Actinomycetota bacterium]|nr:wax ester/triacylglycerol synthase family O-acyltransferase [Actinomycetota bacterium]
QKVVDRPLPLTSPIWIDDEQFDLSYHVRHAALPRPGRTDQLMEYVGRLISRPLDRKRPLWELYVMEGLEDGRVAYLGKTHHAMVDGVTGIDIATLLLDFDHDPGDFAQPRVWHPAPRPNTVRLAAGAVRDVVTGPRSVVAGMQRLATAPQGAMASTVRIAQGVASMARSGVRPGPPNPLNRPNGISRRFAIQRVPFDDVRRVKNTFNTTINDVVLAMVGDAVGRFLRARGEDTRGLTLKVMVPVSVRADDDRHLFGNRVSSVFIRLPVDEMDPVERLQHIHEGMREIKDHQQVVGADFLVGLTAYAPPTLHALAARLAARTRMYNFVVTNVPGPQVPMYSLGMRLLGAFPAVPLAQNHSFAAGVTSLDGWLNFGFVGDWDALPDLENVTGCLVESLGELMEHAEAAGARTELARRSRP